MSTFIIFNHEDAQRECCLLKFMNEC